MIASEVIPGLAVGPPRFIRLCLTRRCFVALGVIAWWRAVLRQPLTQMVSDGRQTLGIGHSKGSVDATRPGGEIGAVRTPAAGIRSGQQSGTAGCPVGIWPSPVYRSSAFECSVFAFRLANSHRSPKSPILPVNAVLFCPKERVESDAERMRVLLDEDQLQAGVERLATEIDRYYGENRPLTVIAVMTGSLVFVCRLDSSAVDATTSWRDPGVELSWRDGIGRLTGQLEHADRR